MSKKSWIDPTRIKSLIIYHREQIKRIRKKIAWREDLKVRSFESIARFEKMIPTLQPSRKKKYTILAANHHLTIKRQDRMILTLRKQAAYQEKSMIAAELLSAEMKVCTKCNKLKDIDQFYKNPNKQAAYSYCKPCHADLASAWTKAHMKQHRGYCAKTKKKKPTETDKAKARVAARLYWYRRKLKNV